MKKSDIDKVKIPNCMMALSFNCFARASRSDPSCTSWLATQLTWKLFFNLMLNLTKTSKITLPNKLSQYPQTAPDVKKHEHGQHSLFLAWTAALSAMPAELLRVGWNMMSNPVFCCNK